MLTGAGDIVILFTLSCFSSLLLNFHFSAIYQVCTQHTTQIQTTAERAIYNIVPYHATKRGLDHTPAASQLLLAASCGTPLRMPVIIVPIILGQISSNLIIRLRIFKHLHIDIDNAHALRRTAQFR